MASNWSVELGVVSPSLQYKGVRNAVNFNYKWIIGNFNSNFESLESPTFSNETNKAIGWRMKIERKNITSSTPLLGRSPASLQFTPFSAPDDAIYCVTLFLVSTDVTKIQTMCKFRLLSVIPEATVTWMKRSQFLFGMGMHCFDKKKQEFLNPENGFLQDGNITLTCEINAVIEISIPHTIPKCTLLDDLEVIFENRQFTDFTFCVSGKEFPAHRSILAARSPVFNAMFNHEMEESKQNWVAITEVDCDVFNEFLRYIYTGKVSHLEEFAIDLLPAADKYGLEKLKVLCEKELCTNISIENAAEVLILADRHNLDQLKTVAIGYIGYRATAVSKTDGWNLMIQSHPGLVTEVLCDVSTQLQVMGSSTI